MPGDRAVGGVVRELREERECADSWREAVRGSPMRKLSASRTRKSFERSVISEKPCAPRS